MRIPKRPPSVDGLCEDPDALRRILARVDGPTVDGKYLHWNRLRYHPLPGGLTHEEWWAGLKLRRTSLYRPVPLLDQMGRPFQFGLVDPLPELFHRVDLEAGGTIAMAERIANSATRQAYLVRSLIEEAYTSSQLEGAATTRAEAKDMIRKGRQPRTRGERMVLNNYRTMEQIQEWKEEPLTPRLVFDMHRMVTQGTLDNPDGTGRFRRSDEKIVVGSEVEDVVYHVPPPADQLSARLDRLCAFANQEGNSPFIHPVARSMILHFWLAYDHPFVDGNGRTARALFYWSMLRRGYWLFEFVSISSPILQAPMKYQRAFLETETDANDLTYFLLYHGTIIDRAIRQLSDYLDRKAAEVREAQTGLRELDDLNIRHRQILVEALRHPGQSFTVASHQKTTGVVTQTARTDLLGLVERGFLEKRKIGRAWEFFPAADLAERLRPGPSRSGGVSGQP